jgi:hypothetical protein
VEASRPEGDDRIPPDFPRDVAFMAAVFGIATFAWAGWAQERPPRTAWRIVLGALALAGLAVVGLTLPAAIPPSS